MTVCAMKVRPDKYIFPNQILKHAPALLTFLPKKKLKQQLPVI